MYFYLLILLFGSSLADYHLKWEDQFFGNHLDPEKWLVETGGGGWGNKELQYYTSNPLNVLPENGHLRIRARIETYEGHNFTSGRVRTKQSWKYGRFELRARMAKGIGLWPAIWLLPAQQTYGPWPASGEIDIVQMRGNDTHSIMGSIYYGGPYPNGTSSGSGWKHFDEKDFNHEYHIYAIEWNNKRIRWYLDNHGFHQENIERMMWSHKGKNPYTKEGQPFDQPFYLIINLAVGGTVFGKEGLNITTHDASTDWPKGMPYMEIDYVRYYEKC